MAKRTALFLLSLCAPAALLAFVVDAPVLRWVAALAVTTFPVALIALGAARGGRLDRLRGPLVLLWIVLSGSFTLLLVIQDGSPGVLGIPPGLAVMLFGLVLVPFALVCWAYAGRFELRDEDLERLRKQRRG